ncbi:hypothetical protein L596_012996 [Steinernema carpocapsae]|uniref:NACHT domain-containing protein n=1 Tax=Steinernema carpocapsae TaxID=34508 RepID=A0A4U5NZC3_STECR|nr:hypothetical protein L596_012996 [Steinernema carpocapsae]
MPRPDKLRRAAATCGAACGAAGGHLLLRRRLRLRRAAPFIDAAVVKQAKFRDPLYSEILRHLYSSLLVSCTFHGRKKETNIAKEYVLSERQIPMIFQGENGCGKTSLLAKISTEIRHWMGEAKDPVVIVRFIGTTADSSSISPLLTSVCDQIAWNYDTKLKGQSPAELSKLFQHFKRMLALATPEKPLVIFFDSLDLLSTVDAAHELLWFPPTVPANVKFFASFTPGASSIERTIRRLVEDHSYYVTVEAMEKVGSGFWPRREEDGCLRLDVRWEVDI